MTSTPGKGLFRWATRCVVGVAILAAFAWRALERHYPLLPGTNAFTLTLPGGTAGAAYPLVATGQTGTGDLLFIRYLDPTTVVFGYDSWAVGGPVSAPLAIVPGAPRPLQIEMPSLAAPPRVDRRARGQLRVVYDGREVLQGNVHYFGRQPREVWFATNPLGGSIANEPLRGQLATPDGRPLASGPHALFPWTARLRHWLTTAPWSAVAALAAAVLGAGLLAPAWRFGARHVWRPRSEPDFAGHPRPPHVTFLATTAICTAAFVAVVTGFTFRLFDSESFGQFYDYQAASLLAGRLDVPAEALGSESFSFAGKYYGYFGPTPALLRLPFAPFHPRPGRLSRSFLVGYYLACLAAAYALLILAARWLSKRPTWPARADVVLLVGGAGLGSTLFFLGGRAYVYHEAILCGAAFALWSAWGSLRWLGEPARPRWWILALAGGLLSVHARPPTGLFALALLGCTAAVLLLRSWRASDGVCPVSIRRCEKSGLGSVASTWRTPLGVGLLAVLGVLSFNELSYLKFKSFAGAPLQYHVQYHPERLAVTGGRNFHLANLPYGFANYAWRPHGSLRPTFPYLFIHGCDPAEFPGSRIDLAENTLALPYAMPSLVFLAALAAILAVLRWPGARPPVALLGAGTAPMAVALCAAIAVSHRYTGDFVPPLLATAAFGVTALATLPPAPRRGLYAAAALLSAAAVFATVGPTLHFQGEVVWGVPDEVRAHYLTLRQKMDLLLGFSRP